MCPAHVYEVGGADGDETVEVEVNPSNCVQCGAITAKGGRLRPRRLGPSTSDVARRPTARDAHPRRGARPTRSDLASTTCILRAREAIAGAPAPNADVHVRLALAAVGRAGAPEGGALPAHGLVQAARRAHQARLAHAGGEVARRDRDLGGQPRAGARLLLGARGDRRAARHVAGRRRVEARGDDRLRRRRSTRRRATRPRRSPCSRSSRRRPAARSCTRSTTRSRRPARERSGSS